MVFGIEVLNIKRVIITTKIVVKEALIKAVISLMTEKSIFDLYPLKF